MAKKIKTLVSPDHEAFNERVNGAIRDYEEEGYYCATIIVSHPRSRNDEYMATLILVEAQ